MHFLWAADLHASIFVAKQRDIIHHRSASVVSLFAFREFCVWGSLSQWHASS